MQGHDARVDFYPFGKHAMQVRKFYAGLASSSKETYAHHLGRVPKMLVAVGKGPHPNCSEFIRSRL